MSGFLMNRQSPFQRRDDNLNELTPASSLSQWPYSPLGPTAPYPKLIMAGGQPRYGRHPHGVNHINYQDFDYLSPMGKTRSHWAKRLRLNQFQFILCYLEPYILSLGIVKTGLSSYAFCSLWSAQDGWHFDRRWLHPLGGKTRCGLIPDTSPFKFQHKDNFLNIEPQLKGRRISINLPKLCEADLFIEDKKAIPLSLCSRAGYDGFTFTQKRSGVRVTGQLHLAKESLTNKPPFNLEGQAIVDWSAGFMRKHTFWNWANAFGSVSIGDQNKHLSWALNLAAGVNDTGINENALWLGQQLYALPNVLFEFDRQSLNSPWHIYAENNQVELYFTPIAQRQEKLNLGFSASHFKQLYGKLTGTIHIHSLIPIEPFGNSPNDSTTQTLHLNNNRLPLYSTVSIVEDHYAKW